jgi:Delta24-sterol reductase
MDAHDAAVAVIAERIKQFHQKQKPFRIYHGSTNSTRPSEKNSENTVDTSKLNNVISLDKAKKTIVVEPNVAMDALVAATIPAGLVPLVVMEFPGITVGGGFSGTSGESSSYRHGAFDSIVNWIEIVLPTGEVARASKTDRPDIFWGAASAFGTLGTVTLLEVQLKEAKSYVELTYYRSPSMAEAMNKMAEEMDKPSVEYVDGIVYSLDCVIICSGRLVDSRPDSSKAQQFTRRHDPWFYVHSQKVEKQMKKSNKPIVEHIPLVDYLFRYDRGGFWAARYAFTYFITPFNRITRYVLNPFLHTRVMYRAMHKSGLANYYMLQDVGVPYDKVDEFAKWLHQNLKIYPIWLCPLRIRRDSPDSNHGLHAEFANADTVDLMNFGVWGPGSFNRQEFVRQNRALEQKVQELGGKKWLYAHAYYTEDEFWAHYNRESYDTLRQKYGATYLPSVYDKVKVDVNAGEDQSLLWKIWPVRGLYGVYKAISGGDYLLQKKSTQSIQATKKQLSNVAK